MPHARVWLFSHLRFDEAALSLERHGVRVELERRPIELLRLLLLHAGEVVTKDELLDAVWADREVTESSLTKCVARLRQALGDDEQAIIRTVHGYGYQFAAELRTETRPSPPAQFDFEPGQALPHRRNWQLIERLGTGGFADAWLGEHGKTHERRVFKFAHDGVQLTMLKREITLSRLLADRLRARPDIARVLDWNLDAPPFFLERDWSPAGSLRDWADGLGGIGAVPMATRLDLASQTADALAAIHSVGVLHKDVKPANILVRLEEDGTPRICLADLGSGGAFDMAQLDRLGITPMGFTQALGGDSSSFGTVLYTAPELLRGHAVSVQADIYALGVVLFQMVVGDFTRPFAPGWETGVADELLREDIGLAAAGDPADRLADAAMLAERLRSIEARRARREKETLERAENEANRRAVERARARRGPLITVFVTLILALVASSWLFLRAESANRRSKQAAVTAQSVTDFLSTDLLSKANPFLSADPNVGVKQLLASAVANLDRRFKPGTIERAAIEEAVGRAYSGLGDLKAAEPLLQSALATRQALLGDGNRATERVRLDLLELYQARSDNPNIRSTGEAILKAGPTSAESELLARWGIATANCNESGTVKSCIAPMKQLLADARARLGPQNEFFLSSEGMLAKVMSLDEEFDEAIPMAREALALSEEAYGPHHPLTADRKYRLAEVLDEAHQRDEAIQLTLDARADLLAVSGKETEQTVTLADELGILYFRTKRYDEAVPLYQLAIDYDTKNYGEEFSGTREAMNNLAFDYIRLGRVADAIQLQEKVVALDAKTLGSNHQDALWRRKSLGGFYEQAGDLAKAEATYRAVLEDARRLFVGGEWDLSQFTLALGKLLGHEGQTDAARPLLEESVAILDKSLGPDSDETKKARDALEQLGAGKP